MIDWEEELHKSLIDPQGYLRPQEGGIFMRMSRWPDNSSWPLTICLSLSLRIGHASGVKYWCAILVVYHHGHRRCGGIHGLDNGFPEVVGRMMSSTLSSSWIAWSTRSLNAL